MLHDHSDESEQTTIELDGESTAVESAAAARRRPEGRYAIHRGRSEDDERRTIERGPMRPVNDDWDERTAVDDGQHGHADVLGSDEEHTVRAGIGQREDSSTLDEPTLEDADRAMQLAVSPNVNAHVQPRRDALNGKLVVIAGNDSGREFELYGKRLTIGRALDNDVVLTDIAVSRQHMSLKFDGTNYHLADHRSGNGTLVNDRFETGTCTLYHGDRLELGNTVLRLDHPASRGMAIKRNQAPPRRAKRPTNGANGRRRTPEPERSRRPEPRRAPSEPRARAPLPPPRRETPPSQPASPPPPSPGAPPLTLPESDSFSQPPSNMPRIATNPPVAVPAVSQPMAAPPHLQPQSQPQVPPIGLPTNRPATGGPEDSSPSHGFGTSSPMYANQSAEMQGRMPSAMGPMNQFSPMPDIQLKSRRRGWLFGALAAIVIVGGGAAVVFAVMDKGGSEQTQPVVQPDDEPTADPKTLPPLPANTWGTDETVLVSSKGAARPEVKTPDPPPDIDKDKPQGDDNPKPPDDPPDKPPVKPVIKPPPTKSVDVSAVKKKALAQYKAKNFSSAVKTLRDAVGKASKANARRLRNLASSYDKAGKSFKKGRANASSRPTTALAAYESALGADKRATGGALRSTIRSEIRSLIPKAASSYMKSGKFEAAKRTADKAKSYGAGSSAEIKRVRKQLSTEASKLYRAAFKLRKDKQKYKAALTRITKMVPSSDPSYGKAKSKLASLK